MDALPFQRKQLHIAPGHNNQVGNAQIHTVELLEQALEVARAAGYKIREEMVGGRAGAACTIRLQKWLFIDPGAPARERLEQVIATLRTDPATANIPLSDVMRRMLAVRQAG